MTHTPPFDNNSLATGQLRPRPPLITMTTAAIQHITTLMHKKAGIIGLRIGVKNGGCAGMEYTMDYVEQADPLDEVIEQDGACVLIAPQAQMFLLGLEIDYKESLLESGFVFQNPNVVDTCGCGASVKFKSSTEKPT